MFLSRRWRVGRGVRQGSAKPCTPVRLRYAPPQSRFCEHKISPATYGGLFVFRVLLKKDRFLRSFYFNLLSTRLAARHSRNSVTPRPTKNTVRPTGVSHPTAVIASPLLSLQHNANAFFR